MIRNLLLASLLILPVLGCRHVSDASDTLYHETKASTLLKRYEWFKDASAQLDKKQADIRLFEDWVAETKKDYGESKNWPKDVREMHNQRRLEMLGVKSSYNSLAAEYNAAMAKDNHRWTNAGDLPRGADRPLPREYKPYETK